MLVVSALSVLLLVLIEQQLVATEQCIDYQFSSPFFPGSSCEDIYNKNPDSRDRSGYYWTTVGPSRVYCGMNRTGLSCENIYYSNPDTRDKSGYYRTNNDQWVYCNMTAIEADNFISTCAGVDGGWFRLVSLDISAGDHCPSGWDQNNYVDSYYYSGYSGYSGDYGDSYTFCQQPFETDEAAGCYSASFSTSGKGYQRVCGRARGYQKGHANGFSSYHTRNQTTVDGFYVDGLSIVRRGSTLDHIWTYANGFALEDSNNAYNCPCDIFPGPDPPPFVGSDYYCESAATFFPSMSEYFFLDPLWDGSGCTSGSCCEDTAQPWFQRQLNSTTQDDIEARICTAGSFANRATLVDLLELYIQ